MSGPDNTWRKNFSNSLSFRQARVAVVVGFILGIGFSAIQILSDLRREIRQTDATFEQSLKILEEPAFQAAFGLDKVLAQTVVNGLFHQLAISEATIIDSYGDTMYSRTRPQLKTSLSWLAEGIFGEVKSYSTQLVEKRTNFYAGELIIRVDTNVIARDFFKRSGLVLGFGVLRNVLLATVLALIYHKMLTKPLREIADHIHRGATELPVSKTHEKDELSEIALEYNKLSHARAQAVTRLKEEERRYRRLIANSQVSLSNADYSEVIKSLNQLRNEGVDDLRHYLDEHEDAAWQLFTTIEVLSANDATLKLFGAGSEDELMQQSEKTFGPETIVMFEDQLCAIWDKQGLFRAETTFYTLTGEEIIGVISLPLPDTDAGFSSIPVSILDITEFKNAETELTFRGEIIEVVGEGVLVSRVSDGVIIYTNASLDATFGYDRGELTGRVVSLLNAKTDPSPEEVSSTIADKILNGDRWEGEVLNVHKDGSLFWSEVSVTGFEHSVHGALAIAVQSDISDRKLLEDQLRQSQRMEAVGQLTGGVAHDFNNLLAVMLGNTEMLEDLADKTPETTKFINTIKSAVDRASSLTGRLLAFSRQSTLAPVPANVCDLIGGIDDMLQRTLGATIELAVACPDDLWPALIDTHEFENALINLVLNARDAMPRGGRLTIETQNATLDESYAALSTEVTPGDYVQVTVSDTGMGMSEDVQLKVFEPFFTTKDVGKGSGLGLSMVFGFAKQSNGHVTIYSEEGHGTSVRLYLPRSKEAVAEVEAFQSVQEHARGVGHILVVEDDAAVRNISASILRTHGYTVQEAENGHEADQHLRDGLSFDLLFTDMVLPGGLNGVEIAALAQKCHPNIKVLYTTGFAENSSVEVRKLVSSGLLINKPFLRATLLEKVQQVLENKSA
ncbi:PAS domain-containing sensor histidine kinase [uncultured Shimia sp.]|uniref:hybrid sensor histidine kinase/response regulator n=1 Tax=uncultured Shimia sp. TaxID=573152 RepID=UPI0025FD7E7F|nr:PAS domain-containing sensor histidine kinase [uncultured Shimia sp.]